MKFTCDKCKYCISSTVDYRKCSKGHGYINDIIEDNDNLDFSLCCDFQKGEGEQINIDELEFTDFISENSIPKNKNGDNFFNKLLEE